eukprot:6184390-Pleurochrysis_carterae.AAC.2
MRGVNEIIAQERCCSLPSPAGRVHLNGHRCLKPSYIYTCASLHCTAPHACVALAAASHKSVLAICLDACVHKGFTYLRTSSSASVHGLAHNKTARTLYTCPTRMRVPACRNQHAYTKRSPLALRGRWNAINSARGELLMTGGNAQSPE